MIAKLVDTILSLDDLESSFLELEDDATRDYYALLIASLGYFNYLVISNVFAALLYQTIKNSRTITDEDINEIFDYLMDLSLEEK
jgi:glycosylphosphatidylinositol transamidase (GPIT) subunit GPI8